MKKNNIIKTGASVIAIAGILMSQLMPSAETVIKNGDLSVEKWISSGENLNMNNYVQGVDTFENALSDLKRKNTDYKRADDPEYDAICELSEAWDNLYYEERTAEPLLKARKLTSDSFLNFTYGDYSKDGEYYIKLTQYSRIEFTYRTDGPKEWGNASNVQVLTKNGISSDWYGAFYGTHDKPYFLSFTADTVIKEARLNETSTEISGFKVFMNEGITLAEISDMYGYKLVNYARPSDDATLPEWISAAESIDLDTAYSGKEEFVKAIEAAKEEYFALKGINKGEAKAIISLQNAWRKLATVKKNETSLIEPVEGVGSHNGFAAELKKPINLGKYEKLEIVIDSSDYYNGEAGWGISANLQFSKKGGSYTVNYLWFGADANASNGIAAADIGSTPGNTLESVKIQDANDKKRKLILKAIYGYEYNYAAVPSGIDYSLKAWYEEAKKTDISQYTYGTDEFKRALKVCEAVFAANEGLDAYEMTAIQNLKTAWTGLGASKKETASLADSVTGYGNSGGFTVSLKNEINLDEYEKFDIVLDTTDYFNGEGGWGVSAEIQFNKKDGNTYAWKYPWFGGDKSEAVNTITSEAVKNSGGSILASIKIFDANTKGRKIVFKAMYGYKYNNAPLPDGVDNSLEAWIKAADKVSLSDYRVGTDEFAAALNAAKAVLTSGGNDGAVKVDAEILEIMNLTKEKFVIENIDYNLRKKEAYNKLSQSLSNFKAAWRGLRLQEKYLIAVPTDSQKNTASDEIPDEFGPYYYVIKNAVKETKHYYKTVGGSSVSLVGVERVEAYVRGADYVNGVPKDTGKHSCAVTISSLEYGSVDMWSFVPWMAEWGKMTFSSKDSFSDRFDTLTEIGSEPITSFCYNGGFNATDSIECDELILGCIYAVKYHRVPFPKGALIESSGADCTELKKLIKTAETFNGNDFSSDSWSPFKKAVAQSKAAIDDPYTTQAEINALKEKLLKAWGNLRYYCRTLLYDAAANLEWGLEIADNLSFTQYQAIEDSKLPAHLTSYTEMTSLPSEWHKLMFRKMSNGDTTGKEFIEFYVRYNDKLNYGAGKIYVQVNVEYQAWLTIPPGQENNGWVRVECDFKDLLSSSTGAVFKPGTTISAISFTLSDGTSGDIDITSANLVYTVPVEAGKLPKAAEYESNVISNTQEDFSGDVFNCRYEPADDGEKPIKTNTPVNKSAPGNKNRIVITFIIIGGAVLVAAVSATGIIIIKKRNERENKEKSI